MDASIQDQAASERLEAAAEEYHGIGPDAFKAAFRRHPGGVSVITADDGTGPVAMTLTSLASVSAEPPLLIFSLSDLSSATPTVRKAETFVAHLINADEIDIAKLAATHGIDRFGDPALWDRMPTGEPYYTGVANRLRCRTVDEIRAGASTVIVGLVLESTVLPETMAEPLAYQNRTWHRLDDGSSI